MTVARRSLSASGEVVYDLGGEWSTLHEHYGACMSWGRVKSILEIKQEGDRFVVIKLSGEGLPRKGDELIRGELDQKGFKTVEKYAPGWGWSRYKGEITNDCKKMVMDDESCAKITLERK